MVKIISGKFDEKTNKVIIIIHVTKSHLCPSPVVLGWLPPREACSDPLSLLEPLSLRDTALSLWDTAVWLRDRGPPSSLSTDSDIDVILHTLIQQQKKYYRNILFFKQINKYVEKINAKNIYSFSDKYHSFLISTVTRFVQ